MAYTTGLATSKVNVESKIAALSGSETIDELALLNKAATGLNCYNYDDLVTATELVIDAQTPSTDTEEILISAVIMGATQAKTHRYFETYHLSSSSSSFDVPKGAINCYVTGTARSYTNGVGASSPSYFKGAAVNEYKIGVDGSGDGRLKIVVGSSIEVGALKVVSGSNSSSSVDAGQVLYAGVIQPDGPTVSSQVNIIYAVSNVVLKFEIEEVVV